MTCEMRKPESFIHHSPMHISRLAAPPLGGFPLSSYVNLRFSHKTALLRCDQSDKQHKQASNPLPSAWRPERPGQCLSWP